MAPLLLVGSRESVKALESRTPTQAQADQLQVQGHAFLEQGMPSKAYRTWEAAYALYRGLNHQSGMRKSKHNQSLAYLALGQYPNACRQLLETLSWESQICETSYLSPQAAGPDEVTSLLQNLPNHPITEDALHNLGIVLRLLGKIDASELVLNQALALAQGQNSPTQIQSIHLSLANTHRARFNQARDQLQLTDDPGTEIEVLQTALNNAKDAFQVYRSLAETSQNPQRTLRAQLNWLSLYLDVVAWATGEPWEAPELAELQQAQQPFLGPVLAQLSSGEFDSLSAIDGIYGRLNLAGQLLELSQHKIPYPGQTHPLTQAFRQTQTALTEAGALNNYRAKSFALGTAGKLYRHTNQLTQAQHALERATSLAQSIRAWDSAYQWQWELAQLYQQQGKRVKTRQLYEQAIESLTQVRENLLSINADLQFSFREQVEPVYRKYMQLLLESPNPDLDRTLEIHQSLQIAELENYLRCGKLDVVNIADIQAAPTSLHILNFGEQIAVIVKTAEGIHWHKPDPEAVNQDLFNLVSNLEDETFASTNEQLLIRYSQGLYQQLIEPIREYLPKSGSLTFVLDSTFQSLPMSLLHDGEKYLIEDYSVSVALNGQLRQPKPLSPKDIKVLLAGLSEDSPSYQAPDAPQNLSALPEIEAELSAIAAKANSSVLLLNRDFTRDRLRKALDGDLPVVHIASHAQYSSDPDKTVIFAWDKAMNARQLQEILHTKLDLSKASIELLVLSACQTAKGDKRSALGIAGIAAQAGARSTLASLWLVESEATSQLMQGFYENLTQGLPKAKALQRAQVDLLRSPGYSHPYYWSSFILVGSWL